MTARSFQDMLNEYLPHNLLKEELIKRDYILTNCEKDNTWTGGQIIVPFKSTGASSIKLGGLTGQSDIAQSKYVRGSIDDYKEVWGSMIFNHRDIVDHSGKVKEQTFLRVLPDTIDDFMDYFKMVVSVQIGTGPSFATATANGTAGGVVEVDRIDRFCLDQKCLIDDDDSAALAVYVIAINLNTSQVTFSATRGGAAVDLSAYTTAQNAKFYHDGGDNTANHFNSLKSALLSQANGGSANLHGQSKLSAPFLQAINIDGSTVTASNIIEKIFDGFVEVRTKARGSMAKTILMSYKNLASVMKKVELGKGDFKVAPNSRKASIYGWTEVSVLDINTQEDLRCVGIQEWDDDTIVYLDWRALTFRTNGFIRKRTAPDGKQYYETRTTDGYAYILDCFLFGELEVARPGICGIMFGISY